VVNYREDKLTDLKELKDLYNGPNPEDQPGYQPSDERIPYGGEPTGVPKQFAETSDNDVSTVNLSGDDEETATINLSGDDEPSSAGSKPGNSPVAPPSLPDLCAVLNGQQGWLVQDNVFITRANATDRLAALRKKGLTAQLVSNTCIEAGAGGYVIWIGKIYGTRQEALTQVANYEKALQRYGLLLAKLSVRRLE